MSIPKVSFEETLKKFVLPYRCVGCASCVVVCPIGCLEYIRGEPVIVKECQSCGICAQICPKYDLPLPSLEKFVFGRERGDNEDFGIYRRIFVAQTLDKNIRAVCQDGGVVTTLLTFALRKGMIDGAAISGISEEEPLRPIPRFATTREEILRCAGTRYTYSPNILAFKEGVLKKEKSIAFVGTPCQVHALRKIQMLPLRKYSSSLNVIIGLFCSESFTYEGFVDKGIRKDWGIDPKDVKKINIKGGILITEKSGEVKKFSLKEAKKYVHKCVSCPDFSAELSDISVGGLGLDGWTLTILRTERGEELFEEAKTEGIIKTRPIEDEKKTMDLLVEISKKKRQATIK